MEEFIESIEACVKAKNWYAAVALTLVMPDIAGAVDYPHRPPGRRYQQWADRFFVPEYTPYFNGQDCWRLRGSVIHHGSTATGQRRHDEVVRFAFITHEHGLHSSRMNDHVLVRVDLFCEAMCKAARRWLAAIPASDLDRRGRLGNLLRIYSEGLVPMSAEDDRVGVLLGKTTRRDRWKIRAEALREAVRNLRTALLP